jgi:hypothetical protein
MKATDRAIILSLGLLALLVGFYMLMLKPKRDEASKLSDQVEQLQSEITAQEETAAFAEQARAEFPKQYGRMVVLGKAAPDAADSASMLVQLNSISDDADVEFQGVTLAEGGAATAAPAAPAPAPAPPAEGGAAPAETTPAAATTPAPATEEAAASLPIGATVGPAGLPILPYSLAFKGGFFAVGDFIGGVDELVHMQNGQVAVDGRLMTIDGFALEGGLPGSNPDLVGAVLVTTYATPAGQGVTLGASPTAPAPATSGPQITPASAVTP